MKSSSDVQSGAGLDVSVVIPCFNEERTVGSCVVKARAALKETGLSGEIIVVDNASTDRSAEAAIKHGARVIEEKRKGYGSTLIRGFNEARGKYVVFADADESYNFGYTGEFVRRLKGGADFVIGSRFRGKIEKGAMPFLHRYLGTPVLTMILRIFFRINITDVNCGMRGMSREAFLKLNVSCTGMEFASEMIVKSALAGIKIEEMPIDFRKDKRGRAPHLNTFRDGWRHLRLILLFAPKWIFLIPGLLSFFSGIVFMTFVLLAETKYLGIFTMILCQGLVLLGAQFIFYGISSYGVSQFLQYHNERDGFYRFFRSFTIEKGIILGAVVLAAGLMIIVAAGLNIHQHLITTDEFIFNSKATKWGIFGMSFSILGFQMIISSFYLCLFNIKNAPRDSFHPES